jgi:hypothetical protein
MGTESRGWPPEPSFTVQHRPGIRAGRLVIEPIVGGTPHFTETVDLQDTR